LNDFGGFLGKLDIAFNKFDYPVLDRDWVWDIRNISFLKEHITYLSDQTDQKIVSHFIKNYETNIYPIKKFLRRQYIHNDGNDHNVLLNDQGRISGIIDFGDMAHTFLVCELAVALTYLILEDENPQEKIKAVVDGYQSVFPLIGEEIDSLIYLICMRACLTVVTANYRKKLFPDNEYISVTEPNAWKFLRNMADKDLRNFKI
jgi:Ser/Thr protein kinase RdoA (MazF antagonist)